MVNMQVTLGGLVMKNPVTTCSGTFGQGREYAQFVDISRLGAVTTKGVSLNGWQGNETPRIAEVPSGMLNSIGLQNPGVAHLIKEDLPWLKEQQATVIVNVSGHNIEEYVAVVQGLEESGKADAYEINISCPNVDKGGAMFGTDPQLAAHVTKACRQATKRPLFVKLTPNVTDITVIAKAVEAEGADGLSLINTPLGMAVDAYARKPVLARGVGGMSGPAVKPLALRMVWQTYQAVSIPLIGMGGIASGLDAIEFMLAGATAVGVGTANFMNPCATIQVLEGMLAYCKQTGVSNITELIGGLEC